MIRIPEGVRNDTLECSVSCYSRRKTTVLKLPVVTNGRTRKLHLTQYIIGQNEPYSYVSNHFAAFLPDTADMIYVIPGLANLNIE